MATAAVSPGVRRCLCGIWNRTFYMDTRKLSQHVFGNAKRNKSNVLRAATYSQNFSSVAEGETLSFEEQERLLSLVTLKVRGSDEAVLDSYTQFVQRAANVLNLDVSGKVVIPMHIEKRTLLKSPHIYKKHRAQYELRTHTRMLQVKRLTDDTADIFLEYIQRNLPEGVSMSVEQTELESIPEYIQKPTL